MSDDALSEWIVRAEAAETACVRKDEALHAARDRLYEAGVDRAYCSDDSPVGCRAWHDRRRIHEQIDAAVALAPAVARDTIATLRAKIAVLQQKCGEAEEATTEARIAVRDALKISTTLAGGLEEARAREAALVAALRARAEVAVNAEIERLRKSESYWCDAHHRACVERDNLAAALEDMAEWPTMRGSELHDAGAWARAVRERCEAALGAREAAIRLAKKREADLAG